MSEREPIFAGRCAALRRSFDDLAHWVREQQASALAAEEDWTIQPDAENWGLLTYPDHPADLESEPGDE